MFVARYQNLHFLCCSKFTCQMSSKDNRDHNDPPPNDDDNDNDLPDDFFDDDDDENEDEEEEGEGWEFDEDDLDDFDEEEYKRERKEKHDRLHNHPLYKQAMEILHLTEALVASMQPKKGFEAGEDAQAGMLMESAMMLAPKIAGAMSSEDYVYSMQNAAIIRHHAEHLRLSTNTLHHFCRVDRKHCKLHRAEMEKFRELFCEWMEEVKKYDRPFDDEWNVF
jgi:hypothetical protein